LAITFRPEFWSKKLLLALERSHVFASPAVVNRDYEGEIKQSGDTVHIRSLSDPTVNTYTEDTDITIENLTDAQRALVIDQKKYTAFQIDRVASAQEAFDSLSPTITRSGYKLRDTVDTFMAAKYTDAAAANQLGTVAVTTAALAYTQIRKLGVLLTEADVPHEGRYVIVPPWYYGLFQEDDRFVKASYAGTTEGLRNGYVGDILGFKVMVSNNCVLVTGDDWAVQAGVPMAQSFAEQILEMQTFSMEKRFNNAAKALHVYGAKTVRPDCLATVIASET
jgi:N4-gp56 family major capsid protein